MEKYISDYSKMKKNRLMHFQIGLIIALVVALVCVNFSLEKYENEGALVESLTEPEIPVIRTDQKDKKVMPPPPKFEEVKPEEIIEEIDIDPEPEPEPVVDPKPVSKPTTRPTLPGPKPPTPPIAKPVKKDPPPAIIPPAPEPESKEPEMFVEKMPMFKMMENNNATEEEIRKHSDTAIIKFITENVRYPAIARETGIQGTVVVRFVVEKDGNISGLDILRDPGGGCGKAALDVIKKMPKWERVGRQNGRRVRVYFTLPIKFELNK